LAASPPGYTDKNDAKDEATMSARCNALVLPLLSVIALVLCDAAPAHAYIDPGTGSYMLQLLLAGIFASVFVIKVLWKRIVAAFRRSGDGDRGED
jgi:hypothetical protein